MTRPTQTFAVCPDCQGRGTSSAYMGAFTSDDLDQMDDEWRDDYAAGRFDRACDECQGQRVVPACHCGQPLVRVSEHTVMNGCHDHLTADEQDELQFLMDAALSAAAERRMGC